MGKEVTELLSCDGPMCTKKVVSILTDEKWYELGFESFSDDHVEVVNTPVFCSDICHKTWVDKILNKLSYIKKLVR
jgi:hypothetical protein